MRNLIHIQCTCTVLLCLYTQSSCLLLVIYILGNLVRRTSCYNCVRGKWCFKTMRWCYGSKVFINEDLAMFLADMVTVIGIGVVTS